MNDNIQRAIDGVRSEIATTEKRLDFLTRILTELSADSGTAVEGGARVKMRAVPARVNSRPAPAPKSSPTGKKRGRPRKVKQAPIPDRADEGSAPIKRGPAKSEKAKADALRKSNIRAVIMQILKHEGKADRKTILSRIEANHAELLTGMKAPGVSVGMIINALKESDIDEKDGILTLA